MHTYIISEKRAIELCEHYGVKAAEDRILPKFKHFTKLGSEGEIYQAVALRLHMNEGFPMPTTLKGYYIRCNYDYRNWDRRGFEVIAETQEEAVETLETQLREERVCSPSSKIQVRDITCVTDDQGLPMHYYKAFPSVGPESDKRHVPEHQIGPLTVFQSTAGYFVGGHKMVNGKPRSRVRVDEYHKTRSAAEAALKRLNQ